ncbi:MAG: hypothetical protein ACM3JG_19975 [Thiohalocapsa sp.]
MRRVLFTVAALFLSVSAFSGADPSPDVNLFGVLFLFFAFIAWFCWQDIEAGYAYLEDRGLPRDESTGVMSIRFAPLYLRELVGRKGRGC